MRTELELLELLLKVYTEPEFKEFTTRGMCKAVRMLFECYLINSKERIVLFGVLNSNELGYLFPIGEKEPRIKLIKKQIELWKQKS